MSRFEPIHRLLKKIESLNSGRGTPKQKAQVFQELRLKYPLKPLLQLAGLPRSTFYYYLHQSQKTAKYQLVKEEIVIIFNKNKKRYGYRRITQELHNNDICINHKTVQKLMKQLGLVCHVRERRKYNSYKGEVEEVAPNLLKRHFKTNEPNRKWVTDVTEFKVNDQKFYLSPIIDLFNGEVVSYNLSRHPNFKQVTDIVPPPLLHDLAILNPNDTVGKLGNLIIMSNHHEGLVEFLTCGFQKPQHISAGLAVQVAGGFISQNNSGF